MCSDGGVPQLTRAAEQVGVFSRCALEHASLPAGRQRPAGTDLYLAALLLIFKHTVDFR